MDQRNDVLLDRIAAALDTLLRGELPEPIPPDAGAGDRARALVETTNRLIGDYAEARRFLLSLSEGNLDMETPRRNFLVSPFKQLHANLRHLTWQTQQITKGDLNQHVDFLGEFSTSFNAMIESLREKKALEAALQRANALLAHKAVTDALTGIANRIRFSEALPVEFSRSRRYGVALSLVLFDIDHFKRINDTFGHTIGDEVLLELARRVRQSLRQVDLFARWGGEEFVVLLSYVNLEDGVHVAERLRTCIANKPFDGVGTVTCSFGVAQFRSDDDDKRLVQRADEALYRAKKGGRNRVEKESPEEVNGRISPGLPGHGVF